MQISPDSLDLAQRITITSRITSRQLLLLIFQQLRVFESSSET